MDSLCYDEYFNITRFVHLKDFVNFSAIDKHFQKFYKNETIWKKLYTKHYNKKILMISYYDTVKLWHGINKLKSYYKFKDAADELYQKEDFRIDRLYGKIIIPEIGLLINLKEINFEFWTPMTDEPNNLPSEIGSLINLKRLTFTTNGIINLPSEIGLLINPEYLNMGFNAIETLPTEIKNLCKLSYLNIQFNEISEVSEEIYELFNLTHFDISGNKIKTISSKIGNLHSLEYFDIEENQIELLPKEIGNLENLISFKFDKNPLLIQPRPKVKWIL